MKRQRDSKGHLIPLKKKRYIIGVGFPWYGDAFIDFGSQRQTQHGLGSIKLYDSISGFSRKEDPKIIMLNPHGTGNFKKYKLILEEV